LQARKEHVDLLSAKLLSHKQCLRAESHAALEAVITAFPATPTGEKQEEDIEMSAAGAGAGAGSGSGGSSGDRASGTPVPEPHTCIHPDSTVKALADAFDRRVTQHIVNAGYKDHFNQLAAKQRDAKRRDAQQEAKAVDLTPTVEEVARRTVTAELAKRKLGNAGGSGRSGRKARPPQPPATKNKSKVKGKGKGRSRPNTLPSPSPSSGRAQSGRSRSGNRPRRGGQPHRRNKAGGRH